MNKTQLFLKRHSSTILTVIGSAGVVATTILAVRATPKACELILVEQNTKHKLLTPIETVKVAWKPYIPAAITGLSTIACIFGANYLNHRAQASLISAYALLDNSYKEYRKRTRELLKDEAPNFEHEMIKTKLDPNFKLEKDKELFFDYESMRYFSSTMQEVQNAAYTLNQQLCTVGYACLNDFYTLLRIDHVPYGYQLGWSTIKSDTIYGHFPELLKFEYEKAVFDDGLECNIITIDYPAEIEYIM